MTAGPTPGTLVTRPLTFEGDSLFINAEVSEGGSIKVAVLGAENDPVAGYTLDDAVPIETGGMEIPIRWNKAERYTLAPGRHVRLEFQLQNAKLYSFWIQ